MAGKRRSRAKVLYRPWTKREEKLLGSGTDVEIAARLGRSADAVRLHRRLLGIPMHPKFPPWTAAQDGMLGVLHDEEVARRTGRRLTTVRSRRLRQGRRLNNPRRRPWTEQEEKLLGTATDREVGRLLRRDR